MILTQAEVSSEFLPDDTVMPRGPVFFGWLMLHLDTLDHKHPTPMPRLKGVDEATLVIPLN